MFFHEVMFSRSYEQSKSKQRFLQSSLRIFEFTIPVLKLGKRK